MLSQVENMIETYTNDARAGRIKPQGFCNNCGIVHSEYKRHDSRKRQFRFILGNLVKVAISVLLRYRCLRCNSKFTVYPQFALPHKRFILPEIKKRSEAYLNIPEASYHKVAEILEGSFRYDMANGNSEHFFSPTTVWRWIGFWGSKPALLEDINEYLATHFPSAQFLQENFPATSKPYRRADRKKLLETAKQLLEGLSELFAIKRIFPTLCNNGRPKMMYTD